MNRVYKVRRNELRRNKLRLYDGVISYIFTCKLIKINITANIRILIENVLLERKKNVHLPLFRR